jgi:hypothetical protein
MSTLHVAVFRTQVVKDRYFFRVIATGLINYAKKVIPTEPPLLYAYINMTLET